MDVLANAESLHKFSHVGEQMLFPTRSCDAKCSRASLLQVHDESLELAEELSLQGLGEEVSDHLFSWWVLEGKIFPADVVGDEAESAIEVLGRSFAA